MPRLHLYLGLIALSLILTSRSICAAAPATPAPAPSGTPAAATTTPPPAAPVANTNVLSTRQTVDAVPAGLASDVAESRKFYTISASLREEYDDNIFTAKTNKVASSKTTVSPTVIFDFPLDQGSISIRNTFDATYYSNRPGDSFDMQDEFVVQYNHSFSDRFSISAAEQFRYYTEPSLFQSVGTNYYNGSYISNLVNLGFNAQWTPLVSSQTTYSNTIIDYENAQTAQQQNSVENTASQSIGFAILPKINLVFGGIIDDISYDQIARGYTTYTGNTGIDWSVLPSLNLGLRVGGSVIDSESAGTSATPYAAVTLNWRLGARSSLSFNYAHEVAPTDVYISDGQIADRFTTTFRYDLMTNLSTHVAGIFTYGNYGDNLLLPGNQAFTEEDYAIDVGFNYTLNRYVSFDIGYIFSGVSSGENFRDYSRNQVYIGVRGTY